MRRRAFVVALALAAVACGAPPAPAASAPARGPVLRFAYEAIDGRPLSTASLANRFTVIGLLTTYDMASTVEARVLGTLERHHAPRINVAALILEPPENRPLVEAYAKALGLTYPIAIADAATIAGQGPFAGLHHVPSVVILDKEGREVWRHIGLADETALEAALKSAEQAARGP